MCLQSWCPGHRIHTRAAIKRGPWTFVCELFPPLRHKVKLCFWIVYQTKYSNEGTTVEVAVEMTDIVQVMVEVVVGVLVVLKLNQKLRWKWFAKSPCYSQGTHTTSFISSWFANLHSFSKNFPRRARCLQSCCPGHRIHTRATIKRGPWTFVCEVSPH